MSKAYEAVRELILGTFEAEELQWLHSDHWPIKLDRDSALRELVANWYAETTPLDDSSDVWSVFLDAIWGIDWARLGDLVDTVIQDAIDCGDLEDWREDEDEDYDPEADRVSDDELESAAAFLDRGEQSGELRPYAPSLAEGDRVKMYSHDGKIAPDSVPGTVTRVFDNFPAVLVKFDDQDQPVRFVFYDGKYQNRYGQTVKKAESDQS